MNKKILYLILVLSLLLGCTAGCSNVQDGKHSTQDTMMQDDISQTQDESSKAEYPETEDLSVEIKQGTVTTEDMYLNIHNTSDIYSYQFMISTFRLEEKVSGEWKEVKRITNLNRDFLALITMNPGESMEYHAHWQNKYGSLLPGSYRLTKQVIQVAEDKTEKEYCFRVEFNISYS